MPVEMVMKYPIQIETDRDIRSREHIICLTHCKTEVVKHGAMVGSNEVQAFDTENTSTILKIPFDQVGIFAHNFMNCLAASGIQLPSSDREVRRMEELIKAQKDEIEFLRGIAGKAMNYHTSPYVPATLEAQEEPPSLTSLRRRGE